MEKLIKKYTDAYVPRCQLWLVRHGQTDWNLAGRWQGQSPAAPALNETGRRQALAAREQLIVNQFSAIYSSDLLRSRQTAELLAEPLELQVTLEPRLREMDLGDWEGMLADEIKVRFPKDLAARAGDPFNTYAPNGESPKQVARRVISAVDEITARHCGESVLVVAHGISLAVILCLARGIPLENLYEYIPGNAELCRVEWELPRYAGELESATKVLLNL